MIWTSGPFRIRIKEYLEKNVVLKFTTNGRLWNYSVGYINLLKIIWEKINYQVWKEWRFSDIFLHCYFIKINIEIAISCFVSQPLSSHSIPFSTWLGRVTHAIDTLQSL